MPRSDAGVAEIFFLPPYAPELNPTELLNQDVHSHVARHRPPDLTKLVTLTVDYLATRTRDIVHNYFKGEHVAYTLSPRTICGAP